MADGINWNILSSAPNPGEMLLQGYSSGQQAAAQRQRMSLLDRQAEREESQYQAWLEKQRRQRELGETYSTDPTKARTDALAAGEFDLLEQFGKLDNQARDLAAKNAADIAGVGFSLKQKPYEERRALLNNPGTVSYLTQRGFTEEQIAGFDPTDANLDGVISQGQTLAQQIEQFNKTREFGQKGEDIAADNARAELQLEEARRHNQEMERIGGVNAGANVTRANKVGAGKSGGARPVASYTDEELLAMAKGLK